MLSAAHLDNLVRWTPDRTAGHYESHFLKVNLLEEQAALWWKFTITQPVMGRGPAKFEVWAVFFDGADPARSCATRETFSASQSRIGRDALHCVYGDNVLEHGRSKGVMDGFAWDLEFDPPEDGFRHFPNARMYEGPVPGAKALTPAIDVAFRGTATVGDRRFVLDGNPGMQGHNWGRRHAERWVWVHCNAFEDGVQAVFEAVSSKLRLGRLNSPQMTILHLEAEGMEPLTINGWSEMVRATSDLRGLRWRFRGSRGDRGLEGVFSAPPERFVGLNYENPGGDKIHCLNSKIADGELRLLRRDAGIWRLERSLTARATAALEIGQKDETHGVRIHVD